MGPLNLPEYSFKIRSEGNKEKIFDPIRKKYVHLTPEEWVRQNFIQYLIIDRAYPASLISVELFFKVNRLGKRSDIVVYNNAGNPVVIVECKSPNVNIGQDTFDQIAKYNINFKVNYLIVTNGLKHYCCKYDHDKIQYAFMAEIPLYNDLKY